MIRDNYKKITVSKVCNVLCTLLFILTPLISAVLFCAVDGRNIADIYIPLGGWSDEITYYKQIEGMVSYGIPRGYFGYDQSRAMYGPFGTWGFLLLIPYAIFGRLFGWTYLSPIYANILLCVVAFCFIYFFLHPNKRWCLVFSAFWVLFQFLNRHILSGTVEALFIQQLVFVVVIGEVLLSDKDWIKRHLSKRKENVLVIICTAFIFFTTVSRPYYAVFYLIPFWKVVKDKQKQGIIWIPWIALLSIFTFFVSKKYVCAMYYEDAVNLSDMLAMGIAGGINHVVMDFVQILKYMWYALCYHDVVGWYYIFLFVELGIMLFVCIKSLCQKKHPPRMFVVSLIGNGLILLSIMLLYSLMVGGRHILALIVANAVILITETHISMGWVLAFIGILCTLLSGKKEPLPYANEEYVAWMNTLEEVFAENIVVTDELSYDNVVGMPVRDKYSADGISDIVTYYGYLYAVPAGMGVSLDYDYLYDEPEKVKAKYILAHPEGVIRLKLEEMGMKCIVEMDELVLYQREE